MQEGSVEEDGLQPSTTEIACTRVSPGEIQQEQPRPSKPWHPTIGLKHDPNYKSTTPPLPNGQQLQHYTQNLFITTREPSLL